MKNKTILHYKILDKLSEGGMGEVYLARDTKLEREVAIKFLPSNITSNSDERERFKIEAQAAAAINHPNIATIYAIEEVENELFIVMEYINGVDLRQKIQAGAMQMDEVTDIAIQLSGGIKAAHDKGIIHRDIKSSNIMITENGNAKIMDFGIAKIGTNLQFKEEHLTIGTAAYMSPEQTQREKTDHRTDIWSFGVVLYEILTGKMPFKGDYEQAVFYSILNEEPEKIENLNFEMQEQLEDIVNNCLEKDVTKRYQDFSEIIDNLDKIILRDLSKHEGNTGSIHKPKKKILFGIAALFIILIVGYLSIHFWNHMREDKISLSSLPDKPQLERLAIIPFTNLKNDPEINFLGYAMADQIIGALTYMKNISVRPSSAVRKYEKEIVDISSAGKDLRVDYILTGNYLKEVDIIRLNVELVNVNSNELLWRETVEVEYGNVFTLQDIVSEKVVDGLKLQFTKDERDMMHGTTPKNSLAYEYYLRSISFPSSNEGNRLSISMLNKSIELDPSYAPAYSELGFRKHHISAFDPGESKQIHQAEKAFLKALSLNKNLIDALSNLAALYTDSGKTGKSIKLLRRSLKVNPNNASTNFFLGYTYRYAGFLKEAKEHMEKALKLDPQNNRFRSIGTTYTYLGEYDKALQAFELDSGSPFSLAWQGQVYLRMNQREKALEYIKLALEIEPESKLGLWARGMEGYLTGDLEMGLSAMRKSTKFGSSDSEQLYNNANIYGLLGDKEGCISLLKKAVDGGFFNYPYMLTDFFLDSVRDDPDFKKILEKAKEKHIDFKKGFF